MAGGRKLAQLFHSLGRETAAVLSVRVVLRALICARHKATLVSLRPSRFVLSACSRQRAYSQPGLAVLAKRERETFTGQLSPSPRNRTESCSEPPIRSRPGRGGDTPDGFMDARWARCGESGRSVAPMHVPITEWLAVRLHMFA